MTQNILTFNMDMISGRRGSLEGVVKLGSGGGGGVAVGGAAGGGGGGGASPRSYSRAPPAAPRPAILKQGQQQTRTVKPQTIKFMVSVAATPDTNQTTYYIY